MKVLYQGLMRIARTVVRRSRAAVTPARTRHHAPLSTTVELVRQVLAQTRVRVLRGDTHYLGKVVSLVEPHTEIIRKGKLAKPTEFGRLVKIQEAEAQFITDYAVCARRQSERAFWAPALDRHIALFDRAPRLAVADGGFASRPNERAAGSRVRRRTAAAGSRTRSRIAARRSLAHRSKAGSALTRRHGSGDAGTTASGMQRWWLRRYQSARFGRRAMNRLGAVWKNAK
jgi:IS5 family transposase